MAATPSLKIVKQTPYKGGIKTWSNRYHFNGGVPATEAAWTTFADAVVAAEKAIHLGGTVIVEAAGYEAGSDVAVFTKTYAQAGTFVSAGIACPVVIAALIRWSTTARTRKNHPIYLMSYVHGVERSNSGTDLEKLTPTQKTAMETFATAWISGFSDGTNTLVRAGPNGATAISRVVHDELTHRDFRD